MNYQGLWGLTALATMSVAIVINVAPLVSGTKIGIEQRVLVSLLLLVPSVLHVERTATLESIRKMVEGSVQSTVLISNKDIWTSYHRLINTTPDRGT